MRATIEAQFNGQGAEQVAGEIGTKSAPSRHQVKILVQCRDGQPLTALMTMVGRSDRTKFRNQVLAPLITAGFLEMTIPDKPRSSKPKQRYRLTRTGTEFIANLKESQ